MATVWGPYEGTSNNRFRVGIDLSRSGGTVTATYRVECTGSVDDTMELSRSGALTGTTSFRMDKGSSGGSHTVGTWSRAISEGQTLSFGASLSGVYNGATPSVSGVKASRPVSVSTPSAPGTPRIDATTATTVTATFEAPSSDGGSVITNHQYQVATDAAFNNQVTAPQFTGGRQYTVTGLSPGASYFIRARVANSQGWGDWSYARPFSTRLNAPATPSSVSASRVNDTQATVSWVRNSTSAAPYESQQVQRRVLNADGSWGAWMNRGSRLSGTATSFTDSIAANNAFQYRVRAINSSGSSGYGTWGGTLTTTPAPPTSVLASALTTGNRVRWATGAPMPVRTRVERQQNTGTWSLLTTAAAGATEALHSGPSTGTSHRYRVRHETVATPVLVSPWLESNRLSLLGPPSAPVGLGPNTDWDAAEERTFTWTHVPVDESDQQGYQLRYRTNGGSWVELAAVSSSDSERTFPAGFFTNGDTIEWQVRTKGRHATYGPYSASNITQPYARPVPVLNTPTPAQVLGASSVGVTWSLAPNQTGWRVELWKDGVQVATHAGSHATVNALTIPRLENASSYEVRLYLRSGDLWALVPDAVPFTTSFIPPRRPDEVRVTWDVGIGAASIEAIQPTGQYQVFIPPVPSWTVNDYTTGEPFLKVDALGGGLFRLTALEQGPITEWRPPNIGLQAQFNGQSVIEVTLPVTSGFLSYRAGNGVLYQNSLVITSASRGAGTWQSLQSSETDHVQVWRAINDGPWVLIADQVSPGSVVVDPVPIIGDGTLNTYKVVNVSTLPSTSESDPVELAVKHRDTKGWVYLNGGLDMSQVCRVRANAERSDKEGVYKETRRYAGRTKLVEHSGIAETLEWSVSARIAPNVDGASTRDELVRLQKTGGTLCYRDPLGVRWYGSMGMPSFNWQGVLGTVGWSMEELEYTEGYATQERE